MGLEKSKPLSSLIFIPLLSLLFIRPFFSGLAYPGFEIFYQNIVISFAIITLLYKKYYGLAYYVPISLLFLAYVISTIFSINRYNSIHETVKFISYISIFYMVSQSGSQQKETLIKTLVFAASIIAIYSIYQYFWGYQWTINYLKKINSDFLVTSSYAKDILIERRAIGTFPSPNILAGYLIITLSLSLGLAEHIDRRKVWYLASLLIGAAFILTKSLGAWLSFVTAFIICFLPFYKTLKHKKMIALGFLVFVIFVISFIIFYRHERLLNINDSQNSIIQRLNYWRTSLAIIKAHPIKGVGSGNFHEIFLNYKAGPGTDTRYAHNILLQQWLETGVLGLVGLVMLISTFIKKGFSKSRHIFLAGTAFMLHNLVDNTYFIPEVGLFWWVIIGLISN